MIQAISARLPKDKVRFATQVGIALYIILSVIYLILGQTNSDEAWYLYASKLVFQGELPYRDFAFTQMPLLPYIYGVVQIWQSSIAWGRLVSVFLSFGTLGMSIAIARRYGGAWAGACAALFFTAFTFGIYYNTIVKTYALVCFFFAATIFVASSSIDESVRYPLALLYGCMAVLVRVTALFFIAPIFLYVLIAARQWKTRALILLVGAGASLMGGFFVLADLPAARWGIFESHLRHWAGAAISTQIHRVLTERVPDIVENFGVAILLFSASSYFMLRQRGIQIWLRDRLPISIAATALVLFAASHLVNGLWETEYLVPVMTASLPILAILLSDLYGELGSQPRIFAQGILAGALVLLPLTESIRHIDFTGRRLPLAEVDQVANFVAQNSKPTDKVLALEALGAVVEANRSVLPGITLAQFSIQLMDTPTAQRLHVVNTGMIVAEVDREMPAVIVLTDRDLNLIRTTNATDANNLQLLIDERYRPSLVLALFGEFSDTVHVYLRR